MDTSAIIETVMQAVKEAPDKINDLLRDPQGAIEAITGQPLGDGQLTQIVAAVQDKLAAGEIDLSGIDLTKIDLSALGGLGGLLGGSPLGSIAGALGGLFGKR